MEAGAELSRNQVITQYDNMYYILNNVGSKFEWDTTCNALAVNRKYDPQLQPLSLPKIILKCMIFVVVAANILFAFILQKQILRSGRWLALREARGKELS